jgi:nicotinate-nucleotide adenylyltransferase
LIANNPGKMEIGLYFGSFNPIHIGHLIIANHILIQSSLKQIWFIVSPQNPFKASAGLLNEYDRLHLVNLAIEDDDRLRGSNIEFQLPKPSYTTNTLAVLKEKYPEHRFSIVMGSDSFQNLERWKDYQSIIKDCKLILYKRPGFEITNNIGAMIEIMDAPLLEISATYIRDLIKANHSIKYLVPDKVEKEISLNRFYKSKKIT